jgi:acetyltransferase-like isoleucine patch superfamily enzyme
MRVGNNATVGLMVMIDIFFPELVSIGENSVIGYNSTLLGHEYLLREYRKGRVEIGANVLIGANTTVLPGVKIGDNAVVCAGSLVNKDIPPNSFAGGVPVRILGSNPSP